ncbi:MAG: NAD(+)/NADH kinase [Fusobacteriaceae bacterium]
MKKCCIFYNNEKELAKEFHKKVYAYLIEKNVEIVSHEKIKIADFAIVIGGDGTLLRASKEIIQNENIHVIAINAGSLGFLTEIKMSKAIIVIERYLMGKFRIKSREFLEVKIGEKKYDVLNEVVISKGGVMTKLLRIGIYSNKEYMNTYRADGVIICTPTGSTAYSLAAGGPIVVPSLRGIIITPIAPHNLNTRPVVIDGNEELIVKIEDEDRIGYAVLDGETCAKINYNDMVYIRFSGKKLNLVLPEDLSYYAMLRETLKWGDNLC